MEKPASTKVNTQDESYQSRCKQEKMLQGESSAMWVKEVQEGKVGARGNYGVRRRSRSKMGLQSAARCKLGKQAQVVKSPEFAAHLSSVQY